MKKSQVKSIYAFYYFLTQCNSHFREKRPGTWKLGNITETLLAGFVVQAGSAAISAHGSSGLSLIIWKMHMRAGIDVQGKEEKAIHLFAIA